MTRTEAIISLAGSVLVEGVAGPIHVEVRAARAINLVEALEREAERRGKPLEFTPDESKRIEQTLERLPEIIETVKGAMSAATPAPDFADEPDSDEPAWRLELLLDGRHVTWTPLDLSLSDQAGQIVFDERFPKGIVAARVVRHV